MNIIIMRGRSTQGIKADAMAHFGEDHKFVTLALEFDPMALEGDVTPDVIARMTGDLVVIANGGTTELQVRTVLACTRYTGGSWRIIDLQRDYVRELACSDLHAVLQD